MNHLSRNNWGFILLYLSITWGGFLIGSLVSAVIFPYWYQMVEAILYR